MNSVPFWRLDCRTQSYVLGVCLDDRDLASLLPWHEIPDLDGVPSELGRRNYVHSLCSHHSPLSRRLGDLFDLRHLETVVETRSASDQAVRESFLRIVNERETRRYPALLWALSSDPRASVRVLGRHMMCECFLLGCRYVRNAAPA